MARRNLFRFLSSALTSSERYAAVVRHPEAVERALGILDASEYLTEILVRHPEEIATLASLEEVPSRAGSGYLFDHPLSGGGTQSDPVFAYVASSSSSYGEKLSLLRRHYRHRELAEGRARCERDARRVQFLGGRDGGGGRRDCGGFWDCGKAGWTGCVCIGSVGDGRVRRGLGCRPVVCAQRGRGGRVVDPWSGAYGAGTIGLHTGWDGVCGGYAVAAAGRRRRVAGYRATTGNIFSARGAGLGGVAVYEAAVSGRGSKTR